MPHDPYLEDARRIAANLASPRGPKPVELCPRCRIQMVYSAPEDDTPEQHECYSCGHVKVGQTIGEIAADLYNLAEARATGN